LLIFGILTVAPPGKFSADALGYVRRFLNRKCNRKSNYEKNLNQFVSASMRWKMYLLA